MSKSSANPRKYSKGKDALNPAEPLIVYVEVRIPGSDLNIIQSRLDYLLSRRVYAVASVVGVRPESNKTVVTFGVDMGPMRAALRGTSQRMMHGYDLLWDIWEQMIEYSPVFAPPPASSDKSLALDMGFVPAMADYSSLLIPVNSEQEEN